MDITSNSGLASVPAVTQYLRSAEACGVDYSVLLAEVGIDADILKDNRSMCHLMPWNSYCRY